MIGRVHLEKGGAKKGEESLVGRSSLIDSPLEHGFCQGHHLLGNEVAYHENAPWGPLHPSLPAPFLTFFRGFAICSLFFFFSFGFLSLEDSPFWRQGFPG
ncbi:MAG: hypothetical protein A2Y28_00310 [Chlamydiae bacterium GWC2_50_10]|nr:MAG: hypothetical protein A2Z85_03870 [Chlamydiae bacterium GWA2_50_15]OGN54597.1 MAG: hypothetical protein A2Y28_00310 [Chlamydiae bacterium GWC2_50_10]OGN57868.1 MAG: hypothetical protein A3D18_03365 [Chlamydiae bacterium RIFCSPHIGHO2_02_FULL_49_29]OGN63335.1 MAG: hypothetical protein A3E26_00230 [Chlamydiae bacterium RIFCSPHIGHO2_12_FULL_49_32]OGN71903.1 MAG: hypothetical protein A3I15_06060 [Chlamydiae bacterium RIFCSPLOWO2_02_FULL_49_12]OGN75162.1 MAG: hypothetical protein A3G30_00095 